MSSLITKTIEPATGTTVTLGASGDTIDIAASQLKTNTVKDAGGNTLFTSDGAGTLSSVNSALSGSMIFISSQTANGSTTIDFTSGINSTYDEYVFYCVNMVPSGNDGSFGFQANAVGESGFNETLSSTTFAAMHTENNTSAAYVQYNTSADQPTGTAYQYINWEQGGAGDDPDYCSSGELHIFAPSNTTYVTHFYATWNSLNVSHGQGSLNASANFFTGGFFDTTAALDEISFKFSAGNISGGTIYMYGKK